jgi:adenylosuccinate synthase
LPHYKNIFLPNSHEKKNITQNYLRDLSFFCSHNKPYSFDDIWKIKDSFVFEMGQGLGLDQNVDNEWHTTSNTGVINPYELLKDKKDFSAEICYVSRTYLTRHGEGPLEENVKKKEINETMVDKTNVPNDFQGSLRYGFLEKLEQKKRIEKDWSTVAGDDRFSKAMVLTHYNEFDPEVEYSKYYSDSKFEVKERK